MTDIYDLAEIDVIDTLTWLAMFGDGLDASYV